MDSKYSWRILHTAEEKREYAKKFASRPGLIAVDQSWLDANIVIGIFRGEQLVAGFVDEQATFVRTLFEIGEQDRVPLIKKYCGNTTRGVCSITCFWISKPNGTRFTTFYTWYVMWSYVCLDKNNKFAIFATNNNKLHEMYSRIGGTLIYEKPSKTNPNHMAGVYLIAVSAKNRAKFGKFIFRWSYERLVKHQRLAS